MQEFFVGLATVCVYFIICASVSLIFRKIIKIPDELFRKILHFILLTSLLVFVFAYSTWWISALTCICIIAIAYPILFLFERFKTYSETLTERKKGELRSSLIIVFVMFATVISVFWGGFGEKNLRWRLSIHGDTVMRSPHLSEQNTVSIRYIKRRALKERLRCLLHHLYPCLLSCLRIT